MEISQTALFGMLLCGVIAGAFSGLFYDFLRLIRRATAVAGNGQVPPFALHWKLPLLGTPASFGRKNRVGSAVTTVVTVVCDVLFGFLCGITVLLLLYAKNDGIFRLSAPLGVAAGFFGYHFTIGRLTSLFSDGILFFAGLVFRYLFLILFFPFRLLCRAGKRLWKRVAVPVLLSRREKKAQNRREKQMQIILHHAEHAFFGES